MDRVRVVVVGAGRMGARRAGSVASSKSATLVGVVDPVTERANDLAKKQGCASAGSLEDLTGAGDIDAVIISTPNDEHGKVAIPSLNKGRSVFCEKPLSNTLEEADGIHAAWKASGQLFRMGSNAREFGNVRKALQLAREGAIGSPAYGRGWIGFEKAIARNDASYYDTKKIGGGVLVDVGHHIVDLGRAFLGDFDDAFGYSPTPISTDGRVPLDTCFIGTLRRRDGRWFSLQASWQDYSGYLFLEIAGDKGSLVVDSRHNVATLDLNSPGGGRTSWDFYAEGPVSFQREMDTFLEAVRTGKDERGPSCEDGLRTLAAIRSMYASWSSGSWASLPPRFRSLPS
ncbi:MAG: Gfo/Idh/MocA family oxidoreductase [Euryarchaeota archaeon]|nr:Gfo/Idh/MocA family oxidoreductase [Euryarchaeota archaeon]MDE1837254.1 Gfo/Idh/MocA family oxidoreductase [Euryarchaeota archaeon]MDE1879924.1 Gfo/Idh/MocA family oxidoreductase [Euryarchaeota archaeon]MDE2045142.1 Gfo/Idh/MocA family oxidoreductase [Thermoplasmata archaeon]